MWITLTDLEKKPVQINLDNVVSVKRVSANDLFPEHTQITAFGGIIERVTDPVSKVLVER